MRHLLAALLVTTATLPAQASGSPTAMSAPGTTRTRIRAGLNLRLPTDGRSRATRLAQTPSAGPRRPTPSHWAARHPVLLGSIVGFGGGCALGVSQVGGSTDTFFNALDEFACPVVGGIGAGVGAAVGALLSR